MTTGIKNSVALGMIALAGGLVTGNTAFAANLSVDPAAADTIASADITAPKVQKPAEFRYPHRALSNDLEGWAVLEFDIDEAGEISDLEIIDSSNKGLFAKHAMAIVEKSDFSPARRAGNAIPVNDFRIRVRYELRDADPDLKE